MRDSTTSSTPILFPSLGNSNDLSQYVLTSRFNVTGGRRRHPYIGHRLHTPAIKCLSIERRQTSEDDTSSCRHPTTSAIRERFVRFTTKLFQIMIDTSTTRVTNTVRVDGGDTNNLAKLKPWLRSRSHRQKRPTILNAHRGVFPCQTTKTIDGGALPSIRKRCFAFFI